ncbi:MAG: hypothetical protein BHW37_01285 [Firmicutes bacterium CAG:272_52_7]|nr:MAG: hypothetical protein BHW37_01285 [Firmicutes bacterium CAG:272_52_7]
MKPGGKLIYSTCTVNKRENEENRERILRVHPEYSACTEAMPFGKSEATLFPDEHGTDGFYIAAFRKTGDK